MILIKLVHENDLNVYYFNFYLDFQILSIKMSQSVQKEEEPKEGQMDEGVPKGCGERVGRRPVFGIRETPQCPSQIQQRVMADHKYVHTTHITVF